MEISKFKQILRHSQICVGLNAFDYSEQSAWYRMDKNGDVYELFPIDNTEEFLFNINDEKKLQDFYDDILCNVVSYSYSGYIYHCDECGAEKDWDYEINWLTSSYGLCDECYNKLTEEEKEELIEKYE